MLIQLSDALNLTAKLKLPHDGDPDFGGCAQPVKPSGRFLVATPLFGAVPGPRHYCSSIPTEVVQKPENRRGKPEWRGLKGFEQ
ncbi:MAG: hypothetical protein ABGZ53_26895 [Fuerstiella sp.]